MKRKWRPLVKRTEAQVQKAICDYLKYLPGVEFTVTNAKIIPTGGGHFYRGCSTTGWPDITGIIDRGHFFALEVKSHSGKLRPEQQRMIDRLVSLGGIVGVCRCVDDVAKLLEPWLHHAAQI